MKSIFISEDQYKKLQDISSKFGFGKSINKLIEEAIKYLENKYK